MRQSQESRRQRSGTVLRDSDPCRGTDVGHAVCSNMLPTTNMSLDETTTCIYSHVVPSPRSNAASLDVQPIARLFRALGDETRVRIVALLTHGELCVCHIESALDLSQPNVSRQMSVLKAARVVAPRRDGNWIYYRLADQPDPECRRILAAIKAFAAQDELRQDLMRLRKAKGPGISCR